MKKSKVGTIFTLPMVASTIILIFVLIAAIFGVALSPYDPDAIDLSNTYGSFSLEHLLGTDAMGRDMFSRMLTGAHTTIINAVLVVIIADLIGVPLGIICGYYEGMVDSVVMRLWDILASFPPLILAMIFVAIFGKGEMNAVVATGIVYIPMISRLTRSSVLTEKTKTYVESAKASGYSDSNIMFSQIFPNVVPTLLAEFTLDIGYAIIALASLSYLGMGVQAPKSDWGSILQSGMTLLFQAPAVALTPGIAIVVTVVSLNMFTDSIEMYLDPTQRRLPAISRFKKREAKAHGKAIG